MTTTAPAAPTTLIRSATIVDGTESPRYDADLLVAGDRIAQIWPATPGSAATRPGTDRVIDAAGLVLSPGFIDMHAHSDLQILLNPDHEAKLSQGVTTEVLGQDGLSYAPVDDDVLEMVRTKIAGWNTNPADFDFSWRSVGEYLDRLDQGVATNAVYLVPHGTIRALVMGWEDRTADPAEVAAMQAVLRTCMAEGAAGLSAGLTYTPGMYADSAELLALCRTVAEMGGFFAPHHRSYGAGALEAYAEMIDLTTRAGCALHLAHATMNFGPNKGRAPELLALLDTAIDGGADITLDTYPYLPGSTTLSAILPSWSSSGGQHETLQRLTDPPTRDRIREHLEVTGSDGCHGVVAEWDTIEISGVQNSELDGYVGSTIAEIAAAEGRDPFEVCVDILLRDQLGTGILQHVGHEENVQAIMRHSRHTGGSDGLLVGAKPHPRAWGTFPRYLGHYTRELGILTLEECVGHLTGRAARRLGLRDRGLVRAGYAADLVLFDPDTVSDRATFAEPRQPAAGIPYVFVNGRLAVDDGALTGALAGHTLRRRSPGQVK
jgi:N-acyl-D-amino-acid deacylase